MRPINWLLRGLTLAGTALLFVPNIRLPLPSTVPKIVLLVDASSSMGSPNKLEEWGSLAKELERMRVSWKAYSFSSDLKSLSSFKNLEFNGPYTDIGKVLSDANTSNADGVLLVSDGRHNGPDELKGNSLSVPLWTLAVGGKDLPDIGIEEALLEADDSTRLRVRMRSVGLNQTRSRLRLYPEKGTSITREVTLPADRLIEVAISLPETLTQTGFRLELDTLPGEDRTDNNSYCLRQPQTKRQMNVTFLAGRISQETEILLETLRGLPKVSLASQIEAAPGSVLGGGEKRMDVLIVGPLRKGLSRASMDLIRGAVDKKTPILFFEAGEDMPSELENFFPLQRAEAGSSEGKLHSTTIANLLLEKWEAVIDSKGASYRAKPDAESLFGEADRSFIARREKPTPTIAIELPNLADAVRLDREGFASFLRMTLAYLVQGDAFPFSVEVEEASETSIRLTLSSEVDVEQGGIEAWLSPDSHPLSVIPLASRSFHLAGTARPGEYLLNVSWQERRSHLQNKIVVAPSEPERPSRGANYELLEMLAEENGGRLVTIDELTELADLLPKHKSFNFKPIETPWLVIIVGALLLVDIWYRRRQGLP